ncbi:hypothetical protein ACWEHA_42880 [Amycolatopsis nivea]
MLAGDARHALRALDPSRPIELTGPGGEGGPGPAPVNADEGPGMTAAQAKRVFARSLTRAHDGEIELEAAVGEGACFRIVVPLLEFSADRE